MPTAEFPLALADLDAYRRFAYRRGGRAVVMGLSMLRGLAASQGIGPRRLPVERLLPWVWDHQQGLAAPVFADAGEAQAVTDWVCRLLQDSDWPAAVTAGRLFDRAAVPGTALDPVGFCQGFMVGLDLCGHDWGPVLTEAPTWITLIAAVGQANPAGLEGLDDQALARLAPAVSGHLQQILAYWQTPPAQPALGRAVWTDHALWQHLREQLQPADPPYPYDAIRLAHAQRAVVAPRLVQALVDAVQDPAQAAAGEGMLHHFAMALLATWRETAAYQPLLALARLDAATVDSLLGDSLHELYNRAVASVCDGDLQPLIDTLAWPGLGAWVRIALLEAWKLRVIEGDAPLAAFEQALLSLGLAGAERLRRGERCDAGDMEIVDTVARLACEVGSVAVYPRVLEWHAEALLDPQAMHLDEFEADMALPWADRARLAREARQSYVVNANDEMASWPCFTEPPDAAPVQAPIVREGAKIGRNDPCPCGSGKKYKKCHGAN